MKPSLRLALPPGPLRLGVLSAEGVTVRPSSGDYLGRIRADIEPLLASHWIYPDALRKGIRSLLKAYGFHPSGRNRPASEYLAKDLLDRREFKPINNVVDINNHLSLISHLPISVVDLDKAGDSLGVRVGGERENYVFNAEGQVHDLENLLVVTRENGRSEPIASPVKDSQGTKVFAETKRIFVAIYTSQTVTPVDELRGWLDRFSALLRSEAGATEIWSDVIDADAA